MTKPSLTTAPAMRLDRSGRVQAASPAQLRAYQARFIQAGRTHGPGGAPGELYIEAAALQAAVQAGLFEGRAVFVDHALGGEHPSLHNLVGRTSQAAWNPTKQSVEGRLELFDTPLAQDIAALLDALLTAPTPEVGLSLAFYPEVGPPDPAGVRPVSAIHHIESIDLVFAPAAGGLILSLLSSLPRHGLPGAAIHPIPLKGVPMSETSTAWEQAAEQAAQSAILNASGLPAPARQRLEAQCFASPAALNEAIAAERAYLAELSASQVIQLGGPAPRSPRLSGMRTSLDQLSLALEALLAGVRPPEGIPPLSGVRELYHHLSGDYELSGVFQPERVSLAAVTSSTMAGLVANALNKRLANEFAAYPQWWKPFCSEEDFASLQQVRWITLGGVGELPTVSEGAAYTELSWDDNTESASFVKKGGYLGLTLEAIDKDDTNRLRAAPRALAQAAWLTLSKAISAIFTSASGAGPNLADGTALFHSSRGNLGSSALSLTTYAAARTAMRKMTELNSGERLGALTAPRFLLVPPDLEITALQVLASQSDYTYALSNGVAAPQNVFAEGEGYEARLRSARERVIVVDLWTDTNDWAAAADPQLYPTIGIAYRYGRSPEVFSVASPTAGLMFTNDTMPIKVRFFFAAGPMDYRGLYKANVA